MIIFFPQVKWSFSTLTDKKIFSSNTSIACELSLCHWMAFDGLFHGCFTQISVDQTIPRPYRSAWRDLKTNSAPFFSSSVRNSWPWIKLTASIPLKNGGWESQIWESSFCGGGNSKNKSLKLGVAHCSISVWIFCCKHSTNIPCPFCWVSKATVHGYFTVRGRIPPR